VADTKPDLAYFAGFFDGEGSIGIYPKKYVVSMTNTDIRPLRLAQERWGGAINSQGGTLWEQRPQIFRWQIYGHNAADFLRAIRPLVVTKADQIDVYLDALQYVPVGRGTKREPGAAEAIDLAAARLKRLKVMAA
jgi:hypothetical protein